MKVSHSHIELIYFLKKGLRKFRRQTSVPTPNKLNASSTFNCSHQRGPTGLFYLFSNERHFPLIFRRYLEHLYWNLNCQRMEILLYLSD